MAEEKAQPAGPDLTRGVAESELKDDKLLGHVGEDDVLVVRTADVITAVDAHCTHYHGPLAEGLVEGHRVRCPWHHACFDLRTGEALHAPALSPLNCWNVERRDGRIFVRDKGAPADRRVDGVAGDDKQQRVAVGLFRACMSKFQPVQTLSMRYLR